MYRSRQLTGTCGTTDIEQVNVNPPGGPLNLNGFDVDHTIEVCLPTYSRVKVPAADNSKLCFSPLPASVHSRAFAVDS